MPAFRVPTVVSVSLLADFPKTKWSSGMNAATMVPARAVPGLSPSENRRHERQSPESGARGWLKLLEACRECRSVNNSTPVHVKGKPLFFFLLDTSKGWLVASVHNL